MQKLRPFHLAIPVDCIEMAKNFFQHYKDLEGEKVKIGNWLPKDKAIEVIQQSITRYNNNKNI